MRQILLLGVVCCFCISLSAFAAPMTSRTLYARLVDEGLQLAGPSPGREDTVYAQALKVRRALVRNDFHRADAILQRSLSISVFHAGRFQPFSALIRQVAQPAGGAFATHLNAWVKDAPNTAMPYLVRGVYLYEEGWRIRGSRYANAVLPKHMRLYHKYLRLAEADARLGLRLAPGNPYANYLPVWILSGQGTSPALEVAFVKAQARFPEYYALYDLRLNSLSPKWGETVRAMYDFVDDYVSQAPSDSVLRLLYVRLFANLLDVAEMACAQPDGHSPEACVNRDMRILVTPKLEQQVERSLQAYTGVRDKIGFSEILGRIQDDMSEEGGNVAQRYADELIQLASGDMGSDEQLSASNTTHNNFVMDRLTGLIWYRQLSYHEAEKLYRRAVDDLDHTSFRDPAQKQTERARLYLLLAQLFYQQSDYHKAAVYEVAAGYMRGDSGASGYGDEFCGALYHLRLYTQAVSACRTRLQDGGGYDALYWLARAHEALHQIPHALDLYRKLANSESRYRAYSAIEISVIYAERKQYQKMLDMLNAYPWLYHESTDSSRFDIAAAYNNRCYAEMHLGHLHAALKECEASLRYGNLPDAYAKKQEILKRLNARDAAVSRAGF